MEPIQWLKKEKTHLRRLAAMRKRIYTAVAAMDASFFPSQEPIPCAKRGELAYRPIRASVSWAGVYGCAWFHVKATVPPRAAGRHLVAHIDIGGEGLVFLPPPDPEPIAAITMDSSYIDKLQSGTAKSVIEITSCAEEGNIVEYYIDAGFNGRYNIPIGHACFHYAELCVVDDELLAYYYDYLTVLSLMTACKEKPARTRIACVLEESWHAYEKNSSLGRAMLHKIISSTPDPSVRFTAIGHSHLDLAWLWPLRETKRKAARTFAHQLTNLRRYPDYVYGASQPQQFEFIRHKYPGQYEELRSYARQGRVECQGAMWVEADTNLSSGEALIRQILYGKKFFSEEFGQEMKICWLPDVFGYNGNLPQLLQKSGVPNFMTIKLSWNEHNRFPYRSFVWRGIDGSEVLVHMPPADTYNSAASPACAAFARDNYTERDLCGEALMIYGIGDGGGGPGEAHIEMARRQASLAGSPELHFGTAQEFFDRLQLAKDMLPVYEGELYLEKHQGTYTTQGANKRFNRKCEYGLQDAEALCALAAAFGKPYPKKTLERIWKEVLLYQFHDILPGSSIRRVYDETRVRYAALIQKLAEIRAVSLAYLTEKSGAGNVLSAFNPTSFERHALIRSGGKWYAADLPAYGFAKLTPAVRSKALACGEDFLENEILIVKFAPDGEICSLVEKSSGFDYAKGRLNRLTLYRDKRLHYNAWDIDWEYYKKPYETLKAVRHKSFCDGIRAVRRSIYRHGKTILIQDVELYAGSGVVRFATFCDWHENLRMLRAEFEPSVFAPEVTCDIQLGSLKRSTGDATPVEKAQFEICAHKYVDVSDETRGLSLMNDCKYGHRVKNGLLSLNLLRSTIYPDPAADRHTHRFTYALYPHSGACGTDTLRESYFLNKPPVVFPGESPVPWIARTDSENVVVETIKRAENGRGYVIRLYESQGRSCACSLSVCFPHGDALECDLMERGARLTDLSHLTFNAFEIKTILLTDA